MSAIHTAHEAAWLNSFQEHAVDLSWLVRPGNCVELAAHRRARPAAAADGRRGRRLAHLCDPDARVRPVARPAASRLVARFSCGGQRCLGCSSPAVRGGSEQRRSPARRPLQTLKVSLTDAGCTPAKLEAKTGRVTLRGLERRHVEGQRARAEERGRDHPRRAREHRRRDRRLVHARPRARARTHSTARTATRRTTATLVVTGESDTTGDECRSHTLTKATARYKPTSSRRPRSSLAGTTRVRHGAEGRRRARARRTVRSDAARLRGDRAGGRELRQSRSRDRRAHQRRRSGHAVDRLPQDRTDPVGQGDNGRHDRARQQAARRRQDAADACKDD